MIRLAGDAIFSFSSVPLRLAGLAGACVSVVATFYLLFVLGAYFFTDRTVAGWASTLGAVLVLGVLNLTVMWILGEYVGRLYEEVKLRPIYIVRPEGRADARSGAEREQKPEEQAADRQERVGV
jgi:dolichol-phosphate mannosyltransferase